MLQGTEKLTSERVKELFRTRCFFDLADLIHGYLRIGEADRLLYGSDYPYTPAPVVEMLNRTMEAQLKELFDEKQTRKIFHGNAQSLRL
ncbi:hypothetical protein N7462_003925 [Penicillium macrosclerotiorum]|uniref:uncharacterized protein n=1 Tax=Penicillium macrosclerotiorum TaxID=303699 RepID=UPI002546D642|nr:uncharacterized protein N7462_003925 [Penicillium macrosclerotiorum]KAJ5689533.1 hypothetical protein N7462_003925 [Penicillium macrosclerotiorum]